MTERVLGPTGSKRRSRFRFLPLPVILLTALALLLAGSAQAVHDVKFQLDGDVLASTTTNVGNPPHVQALDWNSFFDANGNAMASALTGGFNASSFTRDFRTNPGCSLTGTGTFCTADASTFATGSKDILDINPGWQCTYSNNVN